MNDDSLILNLSKKIIDRLDFSIIIFNKNLKLVYANNFFIKHHLFQLENKIFFKEIFPDFDKENIYNIINSIIEQNSSTTLIENDIKLDFYSIDKNFFIISLSSNTLLRQKIDSEKTKLLLNNMNHAIRTPLNGITGMVSLLLESELTMEQYNYIQNIQESSLSLVSIISDLLDFLKLETQNLSLNLDPFNLEDCINSCINIIQKKAIEKNIQIYKIIHPNIYKYVIGDMSRIKQMILNILDNAIKFTDKGFIKIEVLQEDQTIINISDSGIGMTEENIKHIFDIFTKENTNEFTTTKIGLGIPITKFLIDLMNGSIYVKSKYHKGTTVTLKVPLKQYNFKEEKLTDKKKILIFHTNIKDRICIGKMLIGTNMIPIMISTVEEAIMYSSDTHFDIILLNDDKYIDYFQSSNIILLGNYSKTKRNNRIHIMKEPFDLEELKNLMKEISKTNVENKNIKILNVEDLDINRILNEKILEKLGYHNFKSVKDGIEALDELKKEEYDVVLLDIKMPRKDGMETLEDINKELEKIPYVIVVTAYVSDNIKRECFKRNASDILYKPIKIEDLQLALKRSENKTQLFNRNLSNTKS